MGNLGAPLMSMKLLKKYCLEIGVIAIDLALRPEDGQKKT